jgi:vacuolar iron transporter family protein
VHYGSPILLPMGALWARAVTAERDDYQRLAAIERKHIALVPEGEREEIRQIFAANEFTNGEPEFIVAAVTSDEAIRARTMVIAV